jgi:hypothetical protein
VFLSVPFLRFAVFCGGQGGSPPDVRQKGHEPFQDGRISRQRARTGPADLFLRIQPIAKILFRGRYIEPGSG